MKPHNRLQEGVRAIRFSPGGRLIITHSDDPSVKGGKRIEAMEVTGGGTQILHDIDFENAKEQGARFSEDSIPGHNKNPQSCMTCHGRMSGKRSSII